MEEAMQRVYSRWKFGNTSDSFSPWLPGYETLALVYNSTHTVMCMQQLHVWMVGSFIGMDVCGSWEWGVGE